MFSRDTLVFRLCLTVMLIFGVLEVVPAQKPTCGIHKKSAPPFRVGRSERSNVLGPWKLYLQISVDPKHFNRDDMIALAEKLRKKYGKKEVGGVFVMICDDYRAAKDGLLAYDMGTGQTNPAMRGFYNSNPSKGKPGIEFSTARGRPLDEISIPLDDK